MSYVQLMVRHYSFHVCNSTRGLLLLFNLFTDISVQLYIVILICIKCARKKKSYCQSHHFSFGICNSPCVFLLFFNLSTDFGSAIHHYSHKC